MTQISWYPSPPVNVPLRRPRKINVGQRNPVSDRSKSRSISAWNSIASMSGSKPGIERELVVRQHMGTPFFGAQMRQFDGGNGLYPEFLRRHDSSMAGDDIAIVADKHWLGKAETPDTVGDLPDLPTGMNPGVVGIGSKRTDQTELYSEMQCVHGLSSPRSKSESMC